MDAALKMASKISEQVRAELQEKGEVFDPAIERHQGLLRQNVESLLSAEKKSRQIVAYAQLAEALDEDSGDLVLARARRNWANGSESPDREAFVATIMEMVDFILSVDGAYDSVAFIKRSPRGFITIAA